jgi:5-methylthioadenosine/S-adenosylhomocysteine deaminase
VGGTGLYLRAALADLDLRPPVPAEIREQVERELVERGAGVFGDGLRKRGISVAPRASTSVNLLDRLGVLATRPLMIHCVRLSPADVDAIAHSRSSVAHCPVSNAKLGHGIAPILELLHAGVAVGLGSDSVAFDAATLGGARALGLEHDVGSLEVGKSADLAAFPVDPHIGPAHDPATMLVFAMPGTCASLVTVAGRELVRDGKLQGWDPTLVTRVNETADLMRAWAAQNDA